MSSSAVAACSVLLRISAVATGMERALLPLSAGIWGTACSQAELSSGLALLSQKGAGFHLNSSVMTGCRNTWVHTCRVMTCHVNAAQVCSLCLSSREKHGILKYVPWAPRCWSVPPALSRALPAARHSQWRAMLLGGAVTQESHSILTAASLLLLFIITQYYFYFCSDDCTAEGLSF